MQNFIDQLVKSILPNTATGLKDHCFVFPTKRAGLFFKRSLMAQLGEKAYWGPQIYSIAEFVQHISGKSVPDPITLSFELFQVYRETGETSSFDAFYPWGQMLLRDFDEVDRYLVDARNLFQHITDFKEIEERFALEEEQLSALKNFWGAVNGARKTDTREHFLRIWQVLFEVYSKFRARLWSQGLAYEGMIYRHLLENPKQYVSADFKTLIFAGFNALSKSEEMLFDFFLKEYDTQVYWDADRYYLDQKVQEAGLFVRQYYKKWKDDKQHHWIITDMAKDAKQLKIMGIPSRTGQCRLTGQLLEEMIATGTYEEEETAVILGEESLLFPMLHSLPGGVETINVTMGFPLRESPMFNLVSHLISLHQNRRRKEKQDQYYHRTVLGLLNNPYVNLFDWKACRAARDKIIAENLIYVDRAFLEAEVKEKTILSLFESTKNHHELTDQIIRYLSSLFNHYKESSRERPVECEFIFQLVKNLRRMQDIIKKYGSSLTIDTYWNLLREVLLSLKLPFSGEPLRGLQLMGFLETRSLDFKNVFILSVNEGIMPRGNKQNSYIPFSLRKAFGLPTHTERDSIFAYHFYRLMQRAENVFLIYDSAESSGSIGGESSRYIKQMLEEMPGFCPNFDIEQIPVSIPVKSSGEEDVSITIEKDKALMAQIHSKLLRNDDTYSFSPSAILTYLSCPLKFYFKYLVRLSERDEVEEELGARTLGTVLHRTIELIYQDVQDQVVTGERIDEIRKNKVVPVHLERALQESYFKDTETGKNHLMKKIVERLVDKILEIDRKEAPFQIKGLEEEKYTVPFSFGKDKQMEVRLKGSIDRLDEIHSNGDIPTLRVMDYKTGAIELSKRKKGGPVEYIGDYFDKPKLKSGFQAMFYAYMVKQATKRAPAKAGIYPLKKINQGVQYLNQGNDLTDLHYEAFEQRLQGVFEELFDPLLPIVQTEDLKQCQYCPYRDICQRG